MFTKGPLYGSCIMALTKHTKLTQVFIHKLITVTAVSKHMKLMLLVGACGVQNGVCWFNTLWPEQNGCHFADDIFKFIFLHENCCILFRFHWFFSPRVQTKISQHWIGVWLGTKQATSHYLDQLYQMHQFPRRHMASPSHKELTIINLCGCIFIHFSRRGCLVDWPNYFSYVFLIEVGWRIYAPVK